MLHWDTGEVREGKREGVVGGCRVLKKYQGCGLLSVKPRGPTTRK
jgi:hypothetical protein